MIVVPGTSALHPGRRHVPAAAKDVFQELTVAPRAPRALSERMQMMLEQVLALFAVMGTMHPSCGRQ